MLNSMDPSRPREPFNQPVLEVRSRYEVIAASVAGDKISQDWKNRAASSGVRPCKSQGF
jgi:hypothetical protein